MKSIILLTLTSLTVHAQACPDVSGTFAGRCYSIRVCDNQQVSSPSGTDMSYVISQKACDKISVVTSNSMVSDRDVEYSPGVAIKFETEKATLYSMLSYGDVQMIREQKVDSTDPAGALYARDTFQKIQSGGLPHLHFSSEVYTASGNCHQSVDCVIPEVTP